MRKTINYILIGTSLLMLIFITCILMLVCDFTNDVYRDSEAYVVEKSSDDLSYSIYRFKEDNPKYKLFTTNEKGEIIYFKDYSSEKYYHVMFYFSDLNITVQCLLDYKGTDSFECQFLLYAISPGTNFGSWKDINTKELSRDENRIIKRKFEAEILNHLGKWKHKRWYN